MREEGRLFKRYNISRFNLNVKSTSKDINLRLTQINLINISFTGCLIESQIPLDNSGLVITLGKRQIHITPQQKWEVCTENNYISGISITFKDAKSFSLWCKLLQAIQKIEKKNLQVTKNPKDIKMQNHL